MSGLQPAIWNGRICSPKACRRSSWRTCMHAWSPWFTTYPRNIIWLEFQVCLTPHPYWLRSKGNHSLSSSVCTLAFRLSLQLQRYLVPHCFGKKQPVFSLGMYRPGCQNTCTNVGVHSIKICLAMVYRWWVYRWNLCRVSSVHLLSDHPMRRISRFGMRGCLQMNVLYTLYIWFNLFY